MFRSDDYGADLGRLSEEVDLRRRPWYYMHAYADPQDANTVWVLNLNCWRSLDGGKTFERSPRRTATTTACGSIRAIRSG